MCLWKVQTVSPSGTWFCVRGNCLERNVSNENSDGKLVFTSLFKTVVMFLIFYSFLGMVVMGLISGFL